MTKQSPNPYEKQPTKAFWHSAVAAPGPSAVRELWEPKFDIRPADAVSTYGSCFAQNFGQALKARDYNWFIAENAPRGMTRASRRTFNYEVFTSRTANIYSTSLLLQWIRWAQEPSIVPSEIWSAGDRWIDPFRPRIEPDGFISSEELEASRLVTLDALKRSILDADVFVFTLGLTERWLNVHGDYEYPMCPGTAGGTFDATQHAFSNMSFADVDRSLREAIAVMRALNPKLKVLLTVSPVPLTATATETHVLVATMHSKSILRAAAGAIAEEFDYVDYFPSYEIINSPVFGGKFFEPNLRSVTREGVEFVMQHFFRDYELQSPDQSRTSAPEAKRLTREEEICEEELLGAFGTSK